MAELASLIVEVTPKGIDAARAQLDALAGSGKKAESSFGDLAKQIVGYTTVANLAVSAGSKVLGGIKDMAVESVRLAASFETAKVQWGVLVGDMAAGEQVFASLQQFAAETPMGFEGINSAAQTLKGFGVETSALIPTLSQLGDIAMGDEGRLQSLSLVYGQVMAQGVAKTQDLYQFINAGVPIFQLLAESMGVSAGEIKTLASDGKIGFKEITDAIKKATDEGGKFYQMMDKTAETTSGKWSTAVDNWKQNMASVGEVVLPAINGMLDWYNNLSAGDQANSNAMNVLNGKAGDAEAAITFIQKEKKAREEELAVLEKQKQVIGDVAFGWNGGAEELETVQERLSLCQTQLETLYDIRKRAQARETYKDLAETPTTTTTSGATDSQKKVAEVQKELREAFASADQNYAWFKGTSQAFDVVGEKAKATEQAVQELFDNGFAMNGSGVQSILSLSKSLGLSADEMNRALGRAQDIDVSGMSGLTMSSFDTSSLFDPESVKSYDSEMKAATKDLQALLNLPSGNFAGIGDDIGEMAREFKDAQQVTQDFGDKLPAIHEQMALIQHYFAIGAIDANTYSRAMQDLANQEEQLTKATSGDFWNAFEEAFSGAGDEIENSRKNLEKFRQEVESIKNALQDIAKQAAIDTFEAIGAAMVSSSDGAEAFQDAMATVVESLVNQLPMLLLNAGLMAIASGQWAVGLGFVAASGIIAIGSGAYSASQSDDDDTEDNALGGVYSSPSLSSYSGGVYASPQLFNFAKGAAVGRFAEAGPEAIMPLTRTSSGALGVAAVGGGGNTTVTVNNMGTNTVASAEESTDSSGSKQVIVSIKNIVKQAMASGEFDQSMSRYGARPVGVRRS